MAELVKKIDNIKFIHRYDTCAANSIDRMIADYNAEKCDYFKSKLGTVFDGYEKTDFSITVFDDKLPVGGAICWIQYEWLTLDLLGIHKNYRHQGIGSEIIHILEDIAREKHLYGIKLDTWDFQAKDFYIKNGFYVWGEFKDCPPGTITYFMRKDLHME